MPLAPPSAAQPRLVVLSRSELGNRLGFGLRSITITITITVAVSIAIAGAHCVVLAQNRTDEGPTRILQASEGRPNEPRSRLTCTHDKYGGRRGTGEQRRVRQPHDRGAIENDEVEHLPSH